MHRLAARAGWRAPRSGLANWAVNTVVGAYYYLRVLVYMYMREPLPGAPVAKPMKSGHVAFALILFPGGTLQAALSAAMAG